jgi:probable rRNA maturation factor
MNNLLFLNKRGQDADFSWLKNLENIVKKKFSLNKSISIALVSEKEIKDLNKVYRNKNKVTDVLSFSIDSEDALGEVLICLEQAKRQAKANQKTNKSELQLLTVHGILHLLGYDHERSDKAALEQEKLEQEILNILNK